MRNSFRCTETFSYSVDSHIKKNEVNKTLDRVLSMTAAAYVIIE